MVCPTPLLLCSNANDCDTVQCTSCDVKHMPMASAVTSSLVVGNDAPILTALGVPAFLSPSSPCCCGGEMQIVTYCETHFVIYNVMHMLVDAKCDLLRKTLCDLWCDKRAGWCQMWHIVQLTLWFILWCMCWLMQNVTFCETQFVIYNVMHMLVDAKSDILWNPLCDL